MPSFMVVSTKTLRVANLLEAEAAVLHRWLREYPDLGWVLVVELVNDIAE